MLSTNNLSIGYPKKIIAKNLNLNLKKGELVALLGQNGAGKSTLIRSFLGFQKIVEGNIFLENQNIKLLSAQEISKKMSVVLTDRIEIGNLKVRELVSLGRTPYTNCFGKLSEKDWQIVDHSLKLTNTEIFAEKPLNHLSDGEKQRVMIARALAQDTPILLLDEPTAHLDLPNRILIFKLLRKLASQTNKAILLATHELDLALRTADSVWLMQKNENILTGTPLELHSILYQTFGVE